MVVAADRLMPILQCTRIFDPADLQCSEERQRHVHNALAFVWDDWGGYHWFLVNRMKRPSPRLLSTVPAQQSGSG